MHRLLLALVLGWAGPQHPSTPPPDPALAALVAQIGAPVSTEERIRQARAEVRHTQRKGRRDRIYHRFAFPDGSVVQFHDQPRGERHQANRERVVTYGGTESAANEGPRLFQAAGAGFGLPAEAVTALQYVSRHEGGFDAINTWDRARFSWGFIQFAGGYGLRPMLAHFKAASPALFEKLLGDYGVDVRVGPDGRAEPVYLDATTGKARRGNAAEQAYGDDLLIIACFIRAGRVPEVKQRQLEAAIRDYAIPALLATWDGVRLADIYRSPRGLAMLIDRQVHEGNPSRLGWAIEHARILNGVSDPNRWSALEGVAMDLAVADSAARTEIRSRADLAADSLARAVKSSDPRQAPALDYCREAVFQAAQQADYGMCVSYRRDEISRGMKTAYEALSPQTLQYLQPEQAAQVLTQQAGAVRDLTSGLRFEYATQNRLRGIRGSELPGP